jgi:integrase
MATISEKAIAKLDPGGTIWDDRLPGFGVRRQAKAAVFVLKYRFDGRQRWITIGRQGVPWSVDTARAEARRLLGLVATGVDPATKPDTAATLAVLAKRFLDEHAATKLKPRTLAEYRRLVDHVIVPAIGNRPLVEVSRQDIAQLHHERRETPVEANRAIACLSAMLVWGERVGLRPDGSNPCRHVQRFRQRARERFLSADELARLGETLAAYEGSLYHVAALRLLLFTGGRLSEVLGLRWPWIDFERGVARLPDSKTGAKTVHLPAPALAVLAELPHIEGCDFVLGGAHTTSFLEIPWRTIRVAAGLADVRLHDLRHAFASVAAASGMGLPIIGKMLGHTQASTTQRYAHLASDPVAAAADATARKIAAALDSTKVVHLRSA